MYNFVFMLKTYLKDLDYAKRLLGSYVKYNIDRIPLFVVVDGEEFELFASEFSKVENVTVISKEEIDVEYACEPVNGISAGYINQEIVKLAFWKLGFCKNYSCIDSELEFIRDFRQEDFMYDAEIPYSVLLEDRDLMANPNYYDAYWVSRQRNLDIIKKQLGITHKHVMTCHGMQTFNAKVLQQMEENFMIPNGYSYLGLLKLSPYEFSWYNYYLQKERPIPIYPCEPHFKTYHMAYQQVADVMQGVSIESLKRSYIGIVINSNYSREATRDFSKIDELSFFIEDENALRAVNRIVIKSRRKNRKAKLRKLLSYIIKDRDKG